MILLFYNTHPDENAAKALAAALTAQRLIACANIFPMQSTFWWQGAVQQEGEWVALFKTHPSLEQAVETAIMALHPYEVPCIVRMEVRANAAYEAWIAESVGYRPDGDTRTPT